MTYSLSSLINENNQEKQRQKQEQLLHIDYFKSLCSIDDDTQTLVLGSNEDKYIVVGPAGSGKTILALSKMYQLELSKSNYRVIIFTRALKEFLKGKMIVADFSNLDKKLFHLDQYKLLLKEGCLNDAVEYVIIDEVQDFSFTDLISHTQNNSKGFFLYGDKKQNIYPGITGTDDVIEKFEECSEFKTYNLNTIFRFPNLLFNFANSINPNNPGVSCHVSQGSDDDDFEKPLIIEFNDYHAELSYIRETISQNNWTSVGILVRNNIHAQLVHKWFVKNSTHNIDAKYEYGEGGIEKEFYHLDFSTSTPKILTYHSSKGLEFDRVFLPFCNVTEKVGTKKGSKGYNYREALYVAFTRPKKGLIVSYNNTPEPITKLGYQKISGRSPLLDEIKKDTYSFKRK